MQHTNGPTAQEDSSPSRTQDVGGLVASLMGGDKHDPASAQDASPEEPMATDPAGVVASLLAAGSMGPTQPDNQADPAVAQTAQSPDPTDLADPSPAPPEAGRPTVEISPLGSTNTVPKNTPVSHTVPNEKTITEGTSPPSDGPAPTANDPAVSAFEITSDSSLSTLSVSDPHSSPRPPEAIITLGSSSMTVISGQPLVLLDHTLSVGGEVATVDGQQVSMAADGMVADSVTVAFSTASPAGNGSATASNSQSFALYTGDVSGMGSYRSWALLAMGNGLVAFLRQH